MPTAMAVHAMLKGIHVTQRLRIPVRIAERLSPIALK